MKVRILIVIGLACILPPTLRRFPSSAFAQTGPELTAPNDEVPPGALLTDRGTELARRLFLLRWNESKMGERHPSLPGLREQIADVQEQLKAWQRAPNPFLRSQVQAGGEGLADAIPAMNETDLRQIVLTLAQEVKYLNHELTVVNERLRKLERQARR